jgi:septum formation protein
MTDSPVLVLASGSPRRLALLEQIGVVPEHIFPAELDETPRGREGPRELAERLARAKAEVAATRFAAQEKGVPALVLAADTVVAVGRRILPKAETHEEAERCLKLLSGRSHRVYTAIALAGPKGRLRERLVETRLKVKRLSREEVAAYLASGEWHGKAGGYAIQGLAAAFVVALTGSHSAVVGLPLYETAALLAGEGYPVSRAWSAQPRRAA